LPVDQATTADGQPSAAAEETGPGPGRKWSAAVVQGALTRRTSTVTIVPATGMHRMHEYNNAHIAKRRLSARKKKLLVPRRAVSPLTKRSVCCPSLNHVTSNSILGTTPTLSLPRQT